jgi:uroporphyrinogen-III synthase
LTRPVAVLRPEPGNRATIERLRAAGLPCIAAPLFEVAPLDWTPPAPATFDRILLTSANALRHGGPGLAALTALPVLVVGSATATAARNAGFQIVATGDSDLAGLLQTTDPRLRLLWLAGEDRTALDHPALAQVVPVYRATALPLDQRQAEALAESVALLHSARAAAHFAAEIDRHAVPRARIRLAAISTKAVASAGAGWGEMAVAAAPDDDALIAAGAVLAIDA